MSKIYNLSVVRVSVTRVTETLFSFCKLVVYVDDRWPKVATAIRAVNLILLLVHLNYGLAGLVAGEAASPALWPLVLSLMLYGVQGVLVLLETVWFIMKEIFRK